MTIKRSAGLLAAMLLGLSAFTVQGLANEVPAAKAGEGEGQHKFDLARQYYGQCSNTESVQFDAIQPYLKAFTDMEVMAATMADPMAFSQLMAVVNDPRTINVMMKCASEPVMWETWMTGMTDFNKMSRTMGHFMNPNMYANWMMAPMNPAMYQPMMQMMTPQYYSNWSNAMMNPAFYQPMMSMADPAWYTPRMNWMINPQSMQPMFNMMSMGFAQPGSTGVNSAPAQ